MKATTARGKKQAGTSTRPPRPGPCEPGTPARPATSTVGPTPGRGSDSPRHIPASSDSQPTWKRGLGAWLPVDSRRPATVPRPRIRGCFCFPGKVPARDPTGLPRVLHPHHRRRIAGRPRLASGRCRGAARRPETRGTGSRAARAAPTSERPPRRNKTLHRFSSFFTNFQRPAPPRPGRPPPPAGPRLQRRPGERAQRGPRALLAARPGSAPRAVA